MTVGDRIVQAREDKGWKRPDLVRESGIPYPTLAGLENGDQANSTFLPELAYALDVSAYWLKTGKGVKQLSHPRRLDAGKLADLIENVEAAAAKQGLTLPPRFRARVVAALYADSGDEPLTAQAIRAALSAVMSSLEEE